MDTKFSDVFKRPLTADELKQLRKNDLVELVSLLQLREGVLLQLVASVSGLTEQLADLAVAASRRLSGVLDLLFGGSFRAKVGKKKSRKKEKKKLPVKGKQLPSQRYPNLEVIEHEIRSEHCPVCTCGHEMTDSRMRETSERIEVIPKVFFVARDSRVVYTCKNCSTGIATAEAKPRLIPGSCYGDSFVKDVILSKLCDLIPIQRYTAIAERQGVEGIPPNSLHEFSRHLALGLDSSYKRHLQGIKETPEPMLADETRHNMMEGSEKKNWWLWSFNSSRGVVLQIDPSRAGAVAANFLKDCACSALMTDAYSGYGRALKIVNDMREESGLPIISKAYCNAHARNNFQASSINDTRISRRIVWIYKIIFVRYRDYISAEGEEFDEVKSLLERAFSLLRQIALKEMPSLSRKSALYRALDYLITYYDGLTLFLSDRSIPMHNNRSEGTLRNSVIGRKTWLGTHSVETARNLAKIMSLVESCKLLKVNPRKYVDDAVERYHKALPALSPYQYWQIESANSS
jgi:transposase